MAIIYTAECFQRCVNGRCTSPGVCTCDSGWTGSSCQTRVTSSGYLFTCSLDKLMQRNHEPSFTIFSVLPFANCHIYKNSILIKSVAIILCFFMSLHAATCSQGCVNGRCTSTNVCTCDNGWTGSSCEIRDASSGWLHVFIINEM